MMKFSAGRFQPYALSLLRIIVGFTFSLHGFQKFGAFGGMGGKGVAVQLSSALGFAAVLEAVGGLLILAGLFTRPVAFLLCGEMAFAYITRHASRGIWPIQNGGELAILYCFIFLFFITSGPGPLSLDKIIRRKS
jgi:putative oxidoreductase